MTADPTAPYLARCMVADRGFEPGAVLEAQPLAEAADLVMTRADGLAFEVLLIVDRETHPDHRFPLTLDAVVAAARACLPYTGEVNGAKLPVAILVWEVGPHTTAAPELARLATLTRNRPGDEKVVVSAWAIDTATQRIVTTARLGGLFHGRRALARRLREPRVPIDQLVPQPPAAFQEPGAPRLTVAMLAVLALLFAAEHLFAVAPWHGLLAPDVLTLIALGGLDQASVAAGQWFRLLTAATLHADLVHLVFNGLALLIGGTMLERTIGRAWLLALFMLGAVGGSLASYALNAANVVSVGASGAIMAVLTAAFVTSFRQPEGPVRTALQKSLLQMGIPALIPLFMGIDYAAHLGGAATGAALGLLLLRAWPRSEPLPRLRRLATLLSVVGVITLLRGWTHLAADHTTYANLPEIRALYTERMIPVDKLPATDAELYAMAEQLATDYPHDPRARFVNAARLADAGDLAGAADNLRLGLAETEVLRLIFPDCQLEIEMRSLLGHILVKQRDHAGAREAVAPACNAGPNDRAPDQLAWLCPNQLTR